MKTQYETGDVVLGNWKLTHLIGEGSFGRVFVAEREDFGVMYKAAVKIITIPQSQSEIKSVRADGMDDKSVTAYFRSVVEEIVQEFALMSKLKGTSNIVSYEDHTVIQHEDEIGWDIIIRMELLTPLLDYMVQHTIKQQTIIKLGMDICRALELCQKYNIVHRDIKPENIFASELGDFKLGDFGIARTVEKTTSGLSKKGTYTYMAPEVYREGSYGSSVDIYSLGLVLYRLLNDNRAPFLPEYPTPLTYNDQETARMKRFSGTKLPNPKNADGRLAEIVLKACAYDPKDRYSSPMQMRQELEAIQYSDAEAEIIYPQGDTTPIKSVDYVEAEEPRRKTSEQDATESVFGSAVSEKTESVFNGLANTHSTADTLKVLPKKKKFPVLAVSIPVAVVLGVLILIVALNGGKPNSNIGGENIPNTQDTSTVSDKADAPNEQSLNIENPPVVQGIADDQTFESLLWGSYIIEGDTDDLSDFISSMKFEEMATMYSQEDEISVLPFRFAAGPQSGISHSRYYKEYPGLDFVSCWWYSKAGKSSVTGQIPYMVDGNILYLAIVSEFNEETNALDVEKMVEIAFHFEGRNLILSRNGIQLKMIPNDFKASSEYQSVGGFVANDSLAYNDIAHISYWHNVADSSKDGMLIGFTNGRYAINPVGVFNEDGTASISWSERYDKWGQRISDPVSLSFRYIWCGEEGLILIDNGQCYLYQTSSIDYNNAKLADSLDVDPESLTDKQVETLIQTQSNVLDDLQTAFYNSGVEANIDPNTGKVTMDTSILFAVNDSTLSAAGMAYLDGFLDVYAAVVLSDAYTGSISEILVEGHTDSDGGYDYNQTLSESRAAAVSEYCLSRQPGLAEIMVTKGCSYDNPIYDKNGIEDKAASRRVVFKFILNVNGH